MYDTRIYIHITNLKFLSNVLIFEAKCNFWKVAIIFFLVEGMEIILFYFFNLIVKGGGIWTLHV